MNRRQAKKVLRNRTDNRLGTYLRAYAKLGITPPQPIFEMVTMTWPRKQSRWVLWIYNGSVTVP